MLCSWVISLCWYDNVKKENNTQINYTLDYNVEIEPIAITLSIELGVIDSGIIAILSECRLEI